MENRTNSTILCPDLVGVLNDVREFSQGNVGVIDRFCHQRGGYCYVPPTILAEMSHKGTRFRPNTRFGKDMLAFARTGRIP